jgi:hypothetical protein
MLKLMKPSAIKVAMAMVAFALAILIAPAAYAQTLISGTVIDHNNDPVIGASVIVKGTKAGVATGMNGEFAIKAEPANYLEVSAIGYTPTSVKVGNQKKLTIVLQENSELLDEVVVIGYGQTTKKELTGSVASVKKDELNPRYGYVARQSCRFTDCEPQRCRPHS